ncbi:hypothetical protein HWN40_05540 [Methanolobus zinderi]|uniref:Uncharacterized protein n=1 Tax=Methanolobus zinderi TaxID=536044 RepID=A0A7D5IPA4_9EURY|nr:hypothetical protein [Methanolobus zinderi]QLC49747.1 hypothetical protein HWN40_05540 [Methanolobus zinderi]
MSRMQFSEKYRTYGEWLKAQPRDTRYAKEIIRKHNLNPSATLSTLRKMRVSDIAPAFSPFNKLSPEQREMRTRALYTLNDMRKGKSLTSAAKEQGINVQDALKHLGNAVSKKNGRWVATKTDSIERSRWLYSNGKRISVVIKSSRDASLISKYLNAVRIAVITGPATKLEAFKGVTIKGVDGKDYPFETDLEKLYELKLQIENPELLPIYDDRS